MDLSIIIVSYCAAPLLKKCLGSIDRHLGDVDHDVTVVDNASTDSSVELVRSEFPAVALITNDRNLGYATAVNQGLARTRGRYVLWLNPDSEFLDSGMGALLRYLDAHTDVGIVGPQLVDPDGSVQLSSRAFPSYSTAFFHRYALLTRWVPSNPYSRRYLRADADHTQIADVDWVSGACLLHRRVVIDTIGPLDERFFMFCEDVDFCLRARQHGWVVRYHPGMKVQHRIGGSSRTTSYSTVIQRHHSMWRYYAKHFRRHLMKDAVVGTAIWGRCALKLTREVLR